MNLFRLTCFLVTCSISVTSQAKNYQDAGSIQYGAFDIIPIIDVGTRFDSNVTREDVNEIESWTRIISPQVSLVTRTGASDILLSYRVRNETYFSSSSDNYTDHFVQTQVNTEFDARNRLKARFDFEEGHDPRGSNFSIGLGDQLTEPDQYLQYEVDLLYSYGAPSAKGRLDLNLNYTELDYDIDIDLYRARDRKFHTIGGTFFYRVGATTDLTFDVIYSDIQYGFDLIPDSPLDSVNTSYLVGVNWEATAKTTGFAKFGYQEKDFDSDFREHFGGVDWALGVTWEPYDYATFQLSTRADTNETNGEGNFIRSESFAASWQHEWLERLQTSVGVSFSNDRYEGQSVLDSIRTDDVLQFKTALVYQFRRWVNVEASFVHNERESNRTFINFDRNQFVLSAFITL